MSHQPSATFPMLQIVEIVESSRLFGCQITADDLLKPVAGKIQHIYEWWMILFYDLTLVDVIRAAEEKLETLELELGYSAEHFREPVYYSMFARTMCVQLPNEKALPSHAIMTVRLYAGIDDFQLSDLKAPTTPRVRRLLSAVINLYLFEREQAAEHYLPRLAQLEELAQKEAEMADQNAELRTRVNEMHAQRAAEEQEVERVAQMLAEKQQELRDKKLENNVLQDARDAAKHEASKAASARAELATKIKQQEIENIRLEGRLLQSPDRVKSNISELSARIAREAGSLKSLEAKTAEMNEAIEMFERWDTELIAAMKVMDEWALERTKHKQAMAEYEVQRARLDELDGTVAELSDALGNVTARLAITDAEMTRLVTKSQRKREQLKQAQTSLTAELAHLLEEKRSMDHEAAAKEREAGEAEVEIRALHESCISKLTQGDEVYRSLLVSVEAYSLKINKALESTNAYLLTPIKLKQRTLLSQTVCCHYSSVSF